MPCKISCTVGHVASAGSSEVDCVWEEWTAWSASSPQEVASGGCSQHWFSLAAGVTRSILLRALAVMLVMLPGPHAWSSSPWCQSSCPQRRNVRNPVVLTVPDPSGKSRAAAATEGALVQFPGGCLKGRQRALLWKRVQKRLQFREQWPPAGAQEWRRHPTTQMRNRKPKTEERRCDCCAGCKAP